MVQLCDTLRLASLLLSHGPWESPFKCSSTISVPTEKTVMALNTHM